MPDLAARLKVLNQRIAAACSVAGRDAGEVRLIGVSKGVSADVLKAAHELGLRDFGESYLQEALPKKAALAAAAATWHFIGPLQSNKTREIATHFDWVHGVDRLKIAQRLSEQRAPASPPLQVCVQVNISGEASKSGCAPEAAAELCRAIGELPQLVLRGLMAIPAPSRERIDARSDYFALRQLFASIRALLPDARARVFDTISAGMSDDFEAAILEGSTAVRIGSALFGERARRSQAP